MGIRVYCGTDFNDYEHEWKQFKELIEIINNEYKNNKEVFYIIGNVYVGDTWLDAIIIKENGIAVVDFKSYEGEVFGKENGDWYVKNPNGEKEVLHKNLFVQLNKNKVLLLKFLNGMREKYFPYIKYKQLKFIRCWGYFESGSSYDNKQLERKNRIIFDVISKDNLLEKLRFLNCGFSFTKQSIEDIISKLNVIKCKGLSLEGEDEYKLQKIEKTTIEEEHLIEKLLNWKCSGEGLKLAKIKSIGTREEVKYTQLHVEIIKSENSNSNWASSSKIDKKNVVDWIKPKEDELYLLSGLPGSGKTTALKKIYEENLDEFAVTHKYFPVLIQLSEISTFEDMVNQLSKNYANIIDEINYLREKGNLLLIFDSWDELNLTVKIQIEDFISDSLNKQNIIVISSRFIDEKDLPKLYNEKRGERKFESNNARLLPLKNKELDNYFTSRKPNLTNEKIKNLKEIIEESKIEKIPLWMDLIVDFIDLYDKPESTEINLLAHWIERDLKRSNTLEESLHLIEEIAFNSYIEDDFFITSQSVKRKLSTSKMKEIQKYGWFVPSGYYRGEEKYDFVHERLREYLAARYVWSNWDNISDKLFNRQDGLLSRKRANEVIHLALNEAKRVEMDQTEIKHMIYEIAGESGWFLKGEINFEKLRDPIFAIVLFKKIKLSDDDYFHSLKQFLMKLWYLYVDEQINNKKNTLSWLEDREIREALYIALPEIALETINEKSWVSDFYHLDLSIDAISSFLDELSNSLIKNIKHTQQFFYILRYYCKKVDQWFDDIIDYLSYIEENPFLINTKNKEDRKTEISDSNVYYSSTKDAFYSLNKANPKIAGKILDKWVSSEYQELNELAIIAFTAEELSRLPNIKDLMRKWLRSENRDIREEVIRKVFNLREFMDFEPDLFLMNELDKQDYEHWFDVVSFYKYRKLNDYPMLEIWMQKEREKLFEWVCSTRSLSETLRALPSLEFPQILQKIPKYHNGPINFEDAIESLNYLTIFEPNDILKDFISFIRTKLNDPLLDNHPSFIKHQIDFTDINNDDFIIQNLTNEDNVVHHYAIDKSLELQTKNIKKAISEILRKDSNLSLEIWNQIFNHRQDLIKDYLEIGIKHSNKELKTFILLNLHYFNYNFLYSKKDINLILNCLNDENRDIRVLAAHLIDYFPKEEKIKSIEILLKNKDDDLKAIGLRVYSINLGINLHRVIIKALTQLKYKIFRPFFDSSGVLFIKSYHDYDYGYILLNRYKTKDNFEQKTSILNFGIIGRFVHKYIKQKYNIDTQNHIRLKRYPFTFDNKDANDISRIFIRPLISKRSRTIRKEDLDVYIHILNQTDHTLLLTVLYYVEDLLLIFPENFNIFEENLCSLLKESDNESILNIVQYLILRYSEESKIEDFSAIISKEKTNRQALWWGLGLRNKICGEKILLEDINKWGNRKILDKIGEILPFLAKTKKILIKTWMKTIESLDDVFQKITRYTYNQYIDFQLLYLDWSLITFLDCGKNTFKPSYNYKLVEGISFLNSALEHDFKISFNDIKELTQRMKKHQSFYFKELRSEILLELGIDQFEEYIKLLDNEPSLYDLNFLFRHKTFLNDDERIKLIEAMLGKIQNIRKEVDLIDGWTGKKVGKIPIITRNREEILEILKDIPNTKILPILKEILEEPSKEDTQFYIASIKELAQQIWRMNAEKILSQNIEEIFIWLLDLSKLPPLGRPSLYGISRFYLKKLMEKINWDNKEHHNLFWDLFFPLYTKPYYSLKNYWKKLFFKDSTEE